jgi:exopolysaccharide biosynthesis polyprenyl glycosylphosphotransferase
MSNRTLHQLLKALTLLLDICLISGGILAAYWLRFESGWLQAIAFHKGASPPLDFYLRLIPLQAFICILTLRWLGLYDVENDVTFETGLTLLKASGIALVATLGAVFFLYHSYHYSRWVMLLAAGLNVVLLFFGRLAIRWLRKMFQRNGIGMNRVAVVGFNENAQQVVQSIRAKGESGYQFLGVILGESPSEYAIPYRVLGGSREIRVLVERWQVHELFIISPAIPHDEIWRIVHDCEGLSVQINVLPDLYEVMIGRTHVTEFDGLPVVRLKDIPLQGWRGWVKRAMDIGFSGAGLVISSPLLLAIAIAVKFTSPGHVIFRQERIGRDGKPFDIYKFRTMRADAEAGVGHSWAKPDDPRQTGVGCFLRRWGLDELPQLINILKGDMSLVGPRPEMSGLIDKFSQSIPHYLDRHRVKCGLTGWAQVNGLRGNTSLEERIRYDLYYIENWSLRLDVEILFRTVWAVVRGSST